jgi:hypothetical protein
MTAPFKHDPQAVLDYTWDWTDWLAEGDSITSYALTPSAGVIVNSDSRNEALITAWMEVDTGATGRLGVVCHVVTAQGREDDRTLYLLVIER